MARFLFFIIVVLINIPTYSQEYFNKRFEYDQTGTWDGSKTVFLLSDGFVLSGVLGTGIDDPWPRIGFYKMDFSGNKLFSKVYGDTMTMYFLGNPGSIIRFSDTIIIVSGSTKKNFQNMEYNEGLLLFMTNSFDTLFTKSYGEKVPPKDTSFILNQVKKVGSNRIITVGTKEFYSSAEKILLLKTDNQGNPIWEKTYGSTAYYQGHSVICTSDGGFAIGGFTWFPIPPPNYTGDAVLVKTDSAGNQKWLKLLGGPYYDTQGMICSTSDGNMVLGFCYCDWMIGETSFRRINLIKLDNAGTVIWDKKYGESTYEKTLLNIRENSDGLLIATGITHLSKEYSSKDLGWIMKTAENGDSLWYREYDVCEGDESNNWLYDAVQTPDKGYLACGAVYPMPPDTGSQDGWVLKVDSLGCESPGNCWVGIKPENKLISNGFDLYPNPAGQQTNIQLRITNYELRIRIKLFDLFGRQVRDIIVPPWQTEYRLDVSGLPAGLYMTVVESGEKIIGREKLVVQ